MRNLLCQNWLPSKSHERNPLKKAIIFLQFPVSVERRNLIGSLALGIEKPELFTMLNVMGDFFLLFDLTMDIFHGKFILERSGHKHHTNFFAVKVSSVTAPIVYFI